MFVNQNKGNGCVNKKELKIILREKKIFLICSKELNKIEINVKSGIHINLI